MTRVAAARGRARQAGTALLVALVVAAPLHAQAPTAKADEGGGRQRWVWALIGVAVGAIPPFISQDRGSSQGICSNRACSAMISGATGGAVGYLIGRERDQIAARRRAWGPPLEVRSRAVSLRLIPESVTPFDGGASIAGQTGAAVVSRDWDVSLYAGRIRGITGTVAMPARGALITATGNGLYAFSLLDDASSGRLLRRGAVRELAALGSDELLLVGGAALRRVRISGTGALVGIEDVAEAAISAEVSAVVLDPESGVLWSVDEDRLVARSAEALTEIGSVALPGIGRNLSLDGTRAAVAAGSNGVFILDIADPAAPRLLGTATGFQFAYDAVLAGAQLYVAAGPRGLLMADVADPANAALIGSGEQFGFAVDLARDSSGRLLVVDRQGGTLHVIELQRTVPAAATLP